jgi:hypothetical protein
MIFATPYEVSLASLNNLVFEAQDIDQECAGHGLSGYCGVGRPLEYAEEEALRRLDIFWDTVECVVVPSIAGIGVILYSLQCSSRALQPDH